MTHDVFERELRSAVEALAPSTVPTSLREHVSALEPAARPSVRRLTLSPGPGWFDRVAATMVAVIAVALVGVAVGSLVLLYGGRAPTNQNPGAGGRSIVWQSSVASLEAGSISIQAGGQTFTATGTTVDVRSDPGTPTYRTLEATWREHGVEMRLNAYFGADETHWWVSEVRVYDGRPTGDWVTFRGPLFRSERGASYSGDVELSGANGRGPASLRISNMRLTAFAPGTNARPMEGCRPIGPADAEEPVDGGPGAADDPLDAELAEMGLARGMDARQAGALLSDHGVCHDFRYGWSFGNTNEGYSQRWCVPPPGAVTDAAYGSQGEVILFVDDPSPRTPDPGTPLTVGCN